MKKEERKQVRNKERKTKEQIVAILENDIGLRNRKSKQNTKILCRDDMEKKQTTLHVQELPAADIGAIPSQQPAAGGGGRSPGGGAGSRSSSGTALRNRRRAS